LFVLVINDCLIVKLGQAVYPLWWPTAWRKTCKQRNFCVGVVRQTQSIVQHLAQTKKIVKLLYT